MIEIQRDLTPADLQPRLERLFELAGGKIENLYHSWNPAEGAPVFTVNGQYTARGWTEWTQGFQFGSALLQYDVTGQEHFLEMGRRQTLNHMAGHVTHTGVHDHGFNNVSTYGNLLRLMNEGRLAENSWARRFYEMALKASGAVQAARWTDLPEGLGYVYSFNGPHSLFADTIRSMRALVVSHQLGHSLSGENDRRISLLGRALRHAETTARYNVYYGQGRDRYDVRGRVAHESIFNLNDGAYRCPSTQQGYSPFTTWTRGHAWILLGYAEQLEYLSGLPEATLTEAAPTVYDSKRTVVDRFRDVAEAAADFYLERMPTDGIPYWDTGAPGLAALGDYRQRPADPYNEHEPVDSSAAAIAAQGLVRLGRWLEEQGEKNGERYLKAGLTVAARLYEEPYLSTDPEHQGILLHSVYHRPNGWDHVPEGQAVPCGESSMWGDYHALELGLLLHRMANDQPYYHFYLDTPETEPLAGSV